MATVEQLKAKYQSVIDLAKSRGVHLKNVHLENDKLVIRGDASNQAIKNEVWNQIKAVDSVHADIAADIGIDSSLTVPAKVYEVVAGDTLEDREEVLRRRQQVHEDLRRERGPAQGPRQDQGRPEAEDPRLGRFAAEGAAGTPAAPARLSGREGGRRGTGSAPASCPPG